MAMITKQVMLHEETARLIDQLRGPEMGWAESAILRQLIEEALARRFSLSNRSLERPNTAHTDHSTADCAATN